MDNNNNNNNVSGIPNVSDIKFDDTPAESFDNLYGGSSNQQSVESVSINQGPAMTSNPAMYSNMNQGSGMAPNAGMVSNMNQGLGMAPNPAMSSNMNQGLGMTSNPAMYSNMNQGPGMTPNAGMVSNMNQGLGMAPNPAMSSNMNQGSAMESNSGTVIQTPVVDLSNIDIDDEKMQSIEEQLSKTSQYNPADFQQEQIIIPTDNQYEKNKSGLTFLIVLFIVLALVVIFLPQITKMIK